MAGHPDAGDRLAALASDTEEAWFIRWASLRRLADLPLEGGSNAMRRAARLAADDSNPALRRMGLRVIGLWGAPSDAGILLERAGGASIQEAAVAATALIDLGEPEAGARMAAFLDHPAASGLYRAHNALGVLALRSRHWEIAERALSHSIEVHPIQVSVLNDWGVALWSLGRVDDAREAWRRALEWNPGYEAARRNLAEPGP
jgi:tetratricopeptide (TPR) repeat protein